MYMCMYEYSTESLNTLMLFVHAYLWVQYSELGQPCAFGLFPRFKCPLQKWTMGIGQKVAGTSSLCTDRFKVLSVQVTCWSDMSLWQNHIHDIQCDLMLQHVNNKLLIKMMLNGRPAIDLFTELSQWHVTWECHTKGLHVNVCDILLPQHVTLHCTSNWFEFMWQVLWQCQTA